MRRTKNQAGFTLPELVVTVCVFIVVAIIGLGLVQPTDYSPRQREAARWQGAAQLAQALRHYARDHGGLPPAMTTLTADGMLIGADDEEMLDLCGLVPTYIKALPIDPAADLGDGMSCENSNAELPFMSGYGVRRTLVGAYEIIAPLAEGGKDIAVQIIY
jgi:type II secretory pathway pseudopilin PulG